MTLPDRHRPLSDLTPSLCIPPPPPRPENCLFFDHNTFSGEAWRTALLTDKIHEQARGDAAKTNLAALHSPQDSRVFWTERLKRLLRLPNFPTGPQVCTCGVSVVLCSVMGRGVALCFDGRLVLCCVLLGWVGLPGEEGWLEEPDPPT